MAKFKSLESVIEAVKKQVIDAAIAVRREMGPVFWESVFKKPLVYELLNLRQVELPLVYGIRKLDSKLRLDLLVNQEVSVALKSVERLLDIHPARVLSYLKLMKKRLAGLINFNIQLLKNGLKRLVL